MTDIPDFGNDTEGQRRLSYAEERERSRLANAATALTASQVTDLQIALTEELGRNVDAWAIRSAINKAGFSWDVGCQHNVLTRLNYVDDKGWTYICTDTDHPSCHEKVKIVSSSTDDLGIEVLDLSVRSYNCLKREGFSTLGVLCSKTVDDLYDIRNLGWKSVDEIIAKLARIDRKLKASPAGELRGLEGV